MKNSRSSLKKWLVGLLIAALALFFAARIYYALTDDFRIGNITYDMPFQESWTIPELSPEEAMHLQRILAQDFSYLGKGAQSYVFVSADGRYVIKFFKFKHLRPVWLIDILPSVGFIKTYQERQEARKERKRWGVFRAYKLAYDVDRKESGLEFIQLNATGNPQRTVTLIDKIGLKRFVDLTHIPFILQDKGLTLRTVLDDLLSHGDLVTAKYRIGQILEMYASEYKKGIYDHDHGVMQNTGFVDDRPIHLDVGKLAKDEAMTQNETAKKDATLVSAKIKQWIETHYPSYAQELGHAIDQKIHELFG